MVRLTVMGLEGQSFPPSLDSYVCLSGSALSLKLPDRVHIQILPCIRVFKTLLQTCPSCPSLNLQELSEVQAVGSECLCVCMWSCVYLGQISVVTGQGEVEIFTVVVGDYPGEHRILVQIIICTT